MLEITSTLVLRKTKSDFWLYFFKTITFVVRFYSTQNHSLMPDCSYSLRRIRFWWCFIKVKISHFLFQRVKGHHRLKQTRPCWAPVSTTFQCRAIKRNNKNTFGLMSRALLSKCFSFPFKSKFFRQFQTACQIWRDFKYVKRGELGQKPA